MVHEEYKDMLAAQALGALEVAEVSDLETHLQGCSECRSELSSWEETAASLAFASLEERPLKPSPELRAHILEALRAEPRFQGAKKTDDAQRQQSSSVVPLQPRVRPATYTWGAIAAGLIMLGLLASLFVLWNQNREARQELARLSEQVRDAQQQLIQQREAIEIVSTPGTKMMELTGTKVMPQAHAMLAYDKNGRAILMAKGLPPAPAGKAYQLWFIAGGQPMPGKVFTTDASGSGSLKDQIPLEARNSAVFAITLEPESGVKSPTGEMYLISAS